MLFIFIKVSWMGGWDGMGWGDGLFLTVIPANHTEIYGREHLMGQIKHKKCPDNSTDTL